MVGWLIDSYRQGKHFLSHVGTEPPLPGYYEYLWGVNVPCSRTRHGLTRVGLEPPTSGFGVGRINHQDTALPCSYMVKTLKNLLSRNHLADFDESLYEDSET